MRENFNKMHACRRVPEGLIAIPRGILRETGWVPGAVDSCRLVILQQHKQLQRARQAKHARIESTCGDQ
jgi:hypothetical protein